MKRNAILLVLLFSLLAPCSTLVAGQAIRVPDRVEVKKDQFSLGDLSPDVPEQYSGVSFGYAPYPGHNRWLSRSEVVSTLRRSGITDIEVEMPEQVLLSRASVLLDPGLVRQAVTSYFASAYPGVVIELDDLEMPNDVALPEGLVTVSVDGSNLPTRLDGVTLKLDITVDGEHQRSQWVRVRGRAVGPVAVLLRDVGFGETLMASDLVVEKRELGELGGWVADPGLVAGSVLKRSVSRGEMLRDRDVREPVLVKRGEVVTLVARTPGLAISTSARARDSGSRGDFVTVENISSRQLVQARVVGLGTVQVDVPGVRR